MFKNPKVVKAVGIGAGAIIFALSAPLLWMLASSGVALIVILLVGGIAAGLISSIGFFGQKLENAILAARKAEARQNPIEQHQNSLKRRREQLSLYRDATTNVRTQINNLIDMVKDQKKKDPTFDFSRMEADIEKMEIGFKRRMEIIRKTEAELEAFKLEIEREIFTWEMAKASRATKGQLSLQDEKTIMAEILDNEASRAIRENFNRACAELDMEVSNINDAKQLSYDGGLTIDVSSIQIPTMEKERVAV